MEQHLTRVKPHEVGINAGSILKFVEKAEGRFGIHSFMVLRHGKLAASGFWYPYRAEDVHVLFSMSKTFTATAVGFAAAEGLLSLDDMLISFFPEDLPQKPCEQMQKMKIRHLLNMATGHSVEPLVLAEAGEGSWIKRFLTSYVDAEPGSVWCYNTPATYMLAAVVQRVTGQKVDEYLKPRLFDPLGITEYWWEVSPEGIQTGGFGFNVQLESLAKFGLLYLQNGMWEGKQILPEGWAEELSKNRISSAAASHKEAKNGYGYQCWRCSVEGGYRGDGAFGQYTVVLPQEDMVIAINSGEQDMHDLLDLFFDTVLPTLDTVSDAETEAALERRLSNLVYPIPQGDAYVDAALRLSGRKYGFAPNRLGLEALSVSFEDVPTLSLTMNGKTSDISLGYEDWIYSKTKAPKDAPSESAWMFEDAAACYCWQGNTLVLTVSYHKTPFVDTFRLSADRFGLVVHFERNVSFMERKELLYGRPLDEVSERYAWKAIVKDGMLEEYCRRHDAIWPELKALLKQAGIKNYTIWNVGNELFGYYECEKGVDYAAAQQANSEVVDRWNEYMKDVMIMEMDPETGAQPMMKQVFLLD